MYKHLSCAAFKIKLTSGSGNAGTCEKLHDRSRIRLRQKAGVCVCVCVCVCVQAALSCKQSLDINNFDLTGPSLICTVADVVGAELVRVLIRL